MKITCADFVAGPSTDWERSPSFCGETFDTGVCHMAHFHDPDGNTLMLHRRYAPREG